MTGRLRILDPDGRDVAPGRGHAVDVGSVPAGSSSVPRALWLCNHGDAPLYFARIRGTSLAAAQKGQARDTSEVTGLALARDGDYGPEVQLGTLEPGEERPFWIRWNVPRDAPAGPAVWTIEAVAAEW